MKTITKHLAWLMLLAGPAMATPPGGSTPQIQIGTQPGQAVGVGAAVDTNTTKAADGTAQVPFATKEEILLGPEDFGAKGDCSTDDSAALNNYATFIRSLSGYRGYRSINLGRSRCYVVKSTVVWAGLNTTIINGNGSTIVGQVSASPIIDAVMQTNTTIEDLFVISQGAPTIAIQLGRMTSGFSGAAQSSMKNVFIDGSYTTCGLVNRMSEVEALINVSVTNRNTANASPSYCADGLAYYALTSSLYTDALYGTSPSASFNSVYWNGGTISNTGTGPAVWMAGYRDHRYNGPFVAVANSSSQPAALIYTTTASEQKMLTWQVHSEVPSLEDILITGAATPVFDGFDYINNSEESANYVIGSASGTTPTIHNFMLHIGEFLNSAAHVFDVPASYSVDGTYRTPAVGFWNLSSTQFRGRGFVNGAITDYGISLDSSVALPSNLNIGSLSSSGSVNSLVITGTGAYSNTIPACSIAPPPSGSQATCAVATVGYYNVASGAGFSGTTTGYTNNDIVTMAASYGCATPVSWKLTVSGGQVTVLGSNNTVGACPASVMTNSALAVTGGTGTGLTVTGSQLGWRVLSATYTSGSGYTSVPPVTFATSSLPATGYVTLNSNLPISAGQGKIVLNSSGTQLGILGAGGAPVISSGAFIDASGVRVSLGTTYTVPANTSLVRFTQTSTVPASNVTLPTAFSDGQPIQFDNYAGVITSLTFSPTVNGWTNGSTLAANTGIRVRWDATSAAWYREQ